MVVGRINLPIGKKKIKREGVATLYVGAVATMVVVATKIHKNKPSTLILGMLLIAVAGGKIKVF